MHIISTFDIAITKREIALAETNSGLVVNLPCVTDKIVIRVVPDDGREHITDDPRAGGPYPPGARL